MLTVQNRQRYEFVRGNTCIAGQTGNDMSLSVETLVSPDKAGNDMSLPGEMLESPDITGNDMSLSGEGGNLPGKAILKG